MATIEGSLSKWTNVMKGWQFRWFVLDDNAGLLSYYTSKEKMMRGVRRGCVRLKGAVIGIDDEDDSTFTITVDGKTFHFQARGAEERENWIRALEDTILRHADRMRWDPNKPTPTVHEYDKKLSEADAYLKILIDQIKALEIRMEGMTDLAEKARCEVIHNHANDMLESIKHSIVMLQIAKNTAHPVNGIYHSQESSLAMEGNQTSRKSMGQEGVEISSFGSNILHEEEEDNCLQPGIELGAECMESRRRGSASVPTQRPSLASLNVSGSGHRPSMTLIVPPTSYSSSEEEDFYDANEFNDTPSSSASPTMHLDRNKDFSLSFQPMSTYVVRTESNLQPFADPPSVEDSPESSAEPDQASVGVSRRISETSAPPPPVRDDGTLDYDALYEDDSDQDCNIEVHGSVVSHLISQVKIGMDLTKVVLPTFILERRSLLEMYADYFAHPDIFIKISEFKDPKERMVQVVRWYLSAYHAGRKSTVAKKPYNPIIGEIFQCYWDIPGNSDNSIPLVTDGPVPWCTRDQLTFIAEQVSHHPPISAFYAEHYNNRISFCAHVWTKSKFLGLSIGVHNIGQGCVSVLDYDEEYIVTFPNGYGRSILTVPWIELGGTVTITCAKTGYNANVEFLTKPFYGGKKHRITAEVFHPNEKKSILTVPWIELGGTVTITCAKTGYNANVEFLTKPFYGGKKHRITAEVFQPNEKKSFLSIAGEWNGTMEAKWLDGRMETFVDVNNIDIVKKNVRPIAEQDENESRRLWKEVTAGLRLKDIERATNAKYELEQRQREEAKDRKDRGEKWETQVFQEAGENWVYKEPLLKRILNK